MGDVRDKKIVIFGCKTTTIFLIDSLKEYLMFDNIVTISPKKGQSAQVADYIDMAQYSNDNNMTCYSAHRYDLKNEEDFNYFKSQKFDIGFVMGWQRLIPEDILNTFSIGVFGMHGSTDDLPRGRGRSPMNWALIENRSFFVTNLFKYNAGVDSGDILDKFTFSIQTNDTAETMHFKNVLAMKNLILKNIDKLVKNVFTLDKQKEGIPSFYPKRDPSDSLIDFNNDIFSIDAFIRAVTKPFNGAFSFIENKKVVLYRASIFETDITEHIYKDKIDGEVLEIFQNGKFIVKCRGGILIVHEYDAIESLSKGDLFGTYNKTIKHFQRNRYGTYDLEVI